MTKKINVDLLMEDICDTVTAYEDVAGIILSAQVDMEGKVDRVGMFLTFDTVEQASLYGEFEVFDFDLEGVQVLYDKVVMAYAHLDVNLLVQN
ncbi:hypothetical protein [Catellicoccus marimammalium]|uniref:Uncharacterized protein n=1 Tax=Catellicoccus marimammalium M35/04/3 TaxID=1234409 RepID=K8Z866_9ENTE|nr:hypothetical protein [Catellicoccus marimammalium]EKU27030.1 hypothetical protein C683_1026 [Catellicoccus marimammalium M35/04/3]